MTLRLPGTFERIGEPTLSNAAAEKLEKAAKVRLDTEARAEIARAVAEFSHSCAAPRQTKVADRLEALYADADRLLIRLAKLVTSDEQIEDSAFFYLSSIGASGPSQKHRLQKCLVPGVRTEFLSEIIALRDASKRAAAKLRGLGGGRPAATARDQLISRALEIHEHKAPKAQRRNGFVGAMLEAAGAPLSNDALRQAIARVRRGGNRAHSSA